MKTERFGAPAMDALSRYRWRGNIRELRNQIERLMIMSAADVVRVDDLPADIRAGDGGARTPASPESQAAASSVTAAQATGGASGGSNGTLREFKDAAERA